MIITTSFTPSNPNPRKFSRGKESLDPEQIFYVYLQIQVEKDVEALVKSFHLVNYYAQEFPQSEAKVVALSANTTYMDVVISTSVGTAKEAFGGTSEKLEAVYGFVSRICANMYQYRPILVSPPTQQAQDAYEQFIKKLSKSTTRQTIASASQ